MLNPLRLPELPKRDMLLKAGAATVIASAEQDMVAEINHATDGMGAHIVFDPVGGPDVAKLTCDGTARDVLPVRRARQPRPSCACL